MSYRLMCMYTSYCAAHIIHIIYIVLIIHIHIECIGVAKCLMIRVHHVQQTDCVYISLRRHACIDHNKQVTCICRYSFGTAVQVLPIPELMPFRLTRQMTGALQPHDALALLQAPCTLAMTALRSGKDILEVCSKSSVELSHQTCLHVHVCAPSQRRHSCSANGFMLDTLLGTYYCDAKSLHFGCITAGQP